MDNQDITNKNTAAKQASKVAAITLSFWVIKIVATTLGDLSGDLLSITLGLGYVNALVLAFVIMAVPLIIQLAAKRFVPVLYWAIIFLSATIGAEFTDTIDRTLHWGTPVGAAVLLACLSAALVTWRLGRGQIVIDPVIKPGDEVFYWLAVIFANSLGSVIGDLVGDRLGLGVPGGIAINVSVIAFLLLLRYKTKTNRELLFWTAFVFARVSF